MADLRITLMTQSDSQQEPLSHTHTQVAVSLVSLVWSISNT